MLSVHPPRTLERGNADFVVPKSGRGGRRVGGVTVPPPAKDARERERRLRCDEVG